MPKSEQKITDLIVSEVRDLAIDPATVEFLQKSLAENTRRAYASDLEDFLHWCARRNAVSLPVPAQAVANYLSYLAKAGAKASTIERRKAAIKFLHEVKRLPSPTESKLVTATWKGIQREVGEPVMKKKAAVTEIIRQMIDVLPDNLIGLRDKALLLVGFAGAFRRSELVALNVGDLDFRKGGLAITVRRSKTDQTGKGRKKAISFGSNLKTCPVRTLKDWLKVSGIEHGAVFRRITKGNHLQRKRLSDKAVASIVKRTALKAGLDPADFAGHSLRSGFATQAAANRAHMKKIMNQGWDTATTVIGYIQDVEMFDDNASGMLGL